MCRLLKQEGRKRGETTGCKHKQSEKTDIQCNVEEDETTAITNGATMLNNPCTCHLFVRLPQCVRTAVVLKCRLSRNRSDLVLRSLRHAQPPSLSTIGFSWRWSSVHLSLSSCFPPSPLSVMRGLPRTSYRAIDRLGRDSMWTWSLCCCASPNHGFSDHTWLARNISAVDKYSSQIWGLWSDEGPIWKPPPKSPLKTAFPQMFQVMRFRVLWLI